MFGNILDEKCVFERGIFGGGVIAYICIYEEGAVPKGNFLSK